MALNANGSSNRKALSLLPATPAVREKWWVSLYPNPWVSSSFICDKQILFEARERKVDASQVIRDSPLLMWSVLLCLEEEILSSSNIWGSNSSVF